MGPVQKAQPSSDEASLAARLDSAAQRMYLLMWHLPPESQIPIEYFGLFVSQDGEARDTLYFDRYMGLCYVSSSSNGDDRLRLVNGDECLTIFSLAAIRLAINVLNTAAQELEESIYPLQPPMF